MHICYTIKGNDYTIRSKGYTVRGSDYTTNLAMSSHTERYQSPTV